jgi:hypothetical protein
MLLLRDVLYVPSLQRNLISFHAWTMMVMIAILEMANVKYGLMLNVLALPSDKTSFIYYHFVKM